MAITLYTAFNMSVDAPAHLVKSDPKNMHKVAEMFEAAIDVCVIVLGCENTETFKSTKSSLKVFVKTIQARSLSDTWNNYHETWYGKDRQIQKQCKWICYGVANSCNALIFAKSICGADLAKWALAIGGKGLAQLNVEQVKAFSVAIGCLMSFVDVARKVSFRDDNDDFHILNIHIDDKDPTKVLLGLGVDALKVGCIVTCGVLGVPGWLIIADPTLKLITLIQKTSEVAKALYDGHASGAF